MIAWGAECLAFKLILDGTGAEAPLDASVFIYAFATIAGSAMPGGLGVSDGAGCWSTAIMESERHRR